MTDTAVQIDNLRNGIVAPPQPSTMTGAGDTVMLMRMLERAASDPAIDLDRMERLFGMLKEIEQRRSEMSYAAAMASAQAKIVPVVRNQRNTHTHSNYADLAAIVEVAMPIINGIGFAVSASQIAPLPGHFGLLLEVAHSGGCTKRYEYQVPLDKAGSQGKINKTDTQAYGSSFTYARRYAICGVFNIATKDDKDGNAQKAPTAFISDEQRKELDSLLEVAGVEISDVLAFHKIDTLAAMPERDFGKAKHMLSERIKKNADAAKKGAQS